MGSLTWGCLWHTGIHAVTFRLQRVTLSVVALVSPPTMVLPRAQRRDSTPEKSLWQRWRHRSPSQLGGEGTTAGIRGQTLRVCLIQLGTTPCLALMGRSTGLALFAGETLFLAEPTFLLPLVSASCRSIFRMLPFHVSGTLAGTCLISLMERCRLD